MKNIFLIALIFLLTQNVFAQNMQKQEFNKAADTFFGTLHTMEDKTKLRLACDEYLLILAGEQNNPDKLIRSDAAVYVALAKSGCAEDINPDEITALLDKSLKDNPYNFIANFFKGTLTYEQAKARDYFSIARKNINKEKLNILGFKNIDEFEKTVKQLLLAKAHKL